MIDLKKLRFEAGVSQEKLGEVLQLPQSTISKMEKGWQKIRPEHIERLVAAYGAALVESCVVPDELFNPHAEARTTTATIIPATIINEAREEGQASMLDELRRRADQMDELLVQQRTLIEQQGSLITQLDDAGKRVDKLIALLDK